MDTGAEVGGAWDPQLWSYLHNLCRGWPVTSDLKKLSTERSLRRAVLIASLGAEGPRGWGGGVATVHVPLGLFPIHAPEGGVAWKYA